jgi:hypothetical protein
VTVQVLAMNADDFVLFRVELLAEGVLFSGGPAL